MPYDNRNLENYQEYVAPLLGNGEMAFQVDYEGEMNQGRRSRKVSHNPGMKIWWAGRRDADRLLIPFGYFQQKVVLEDNPARLVRYAQELDTNNALITTECDYNSGVRISSVAAIHHDVNLIMINKKIDCEKDCKYIFEYILDGQDSCFLQQEAGRTDGGIVIQYAAPHAQRGMIRFFSDKNVTAEIRDHVFSMDCDLKKGENEIAFYLLFCDNLNTKDYPDESEKIVRNVRKKGFWQLLREHSKRWADYYAEGFVSTDDEQLNLVYRTAQYHLKCYTTPWSLPVGLCDELWQGRYFAFDEFYMLMALLSSNHGNAAYRIPSFRAEGLEKATKRASSPRGVQQARYPWETLENGDEGSPVGYWHDHVFHMACIACGEYYYYQYSGDKQFLREKGYPVIKACASFYINHMLYEEQGERLIVGKCTDLERLGSSVANAYMTTCGVIKTLRIFSEMAELLGVDSDMAAECADKAERLMEALPNDGEKYIPYEGCEETSVGLLSGLYPFDVIGKDSRLQSEGIRSYLMEEQKKGNMYAVGSGVCPWYMAWKAIVHERLEEVDSAYTAIKSVTENAGNFAELYEINDISGNTIYRPWFATAAGMFIQAVNEMFVKYEGGVIYIGASLPPQINDFSCRLAAPGGVVVEVSVKNGHIERLRLTGHSKGNTVSVALPKRLLPEKAYGANIRKSNEDYQIIQCKVEEK